MVAHIAQQKIPITLCLNKIDRLIIELKLPPEDAYYKIKQVIDEVNALIKTHGGDDIELLSPIKQNVIFASPEFSFCFSLQTFAEIYRQVLSDYFLLEQQKRVSTSAIKPT